MSIATPGVQDPELLITTYETDVRMESIPQDIFDRLGEDYVYSQGQEPSAMPEGSIMLRLQAKADQGRYVKVPMVKDLSGSPNLGADADPRGNEEDIKMKYFRMEYNDISHVTTNQEYGIYARDQFPYKKFEKRVPLLGRYFKQYKGVMRRQALTEVVSENLYENPINAAARLNKNWWVPTIAHASQPAYSATYATHVNNICTRLNSAGTGTSACASVRGIQLLEEFASTYKLIPRIPLGDGKDGYLLILPSPQVTWLMHPTNSGGMGNIIQNLATSNPLVKQRFPEADIMIGSCVIVSDNRFPTLTIGGSGSQGGNYSASIAYRLMGNADDGSSDPRDFSSTARQIGWLIGPNALCEWIPEDFHWEWEYKMYDKYFGSGLFCSMAYKAVEFNVGTGATAATLQQNGSIALAFATPGST